MYVLDPHSTDLRFPPARLASPEGLLAIGGDLRIQRLLEAYRHGIFPWYSAGQPILWWSPDPRLVLFPNELKISRSLRKTLRTGRFRVTLDTCFRDIMKACAAPRPGQEGTWITPEMIDAYAALHDSGLAHSVEAWFGNDLVGGLYGVALGSMFFGESMFARATDASKIAFVHLVHQLKTWGFSLVDCQVTTTHLVSLGAREIPRADFLDHLAGAMQARDRRGKWQFDENLIVS